MCVYLCVCIFLRLSVCLRVHSFVCLVGRLLLRTIVVLFVSVFVCLCVFVWLHALGGWLRVCVRLLVDLCVFVCVDVCRVYVC